ncbi:hypothetical protein CPB86DRAFT_785993 [Serendipita vermifera]|nr:hypothetical protein CPB86DRAFT_785993 [Serendipita vermifera]
MSLSRAGSHAETMQSLDSNPNLNYLYILLIIPVLFVLGVCMIFIPIICGWNWRFSNWLVERRSYKEYVEDHMEKSLKYEAYP